LTTGALGEHGQYLPSDRAASVVVRVIAGVVASRSRGDRFRCSTRSAWGTQDVFGGSSFIQCASNYSGVMPVIFASASCWATMLLNFLAAFTI